MVRRGEKKAGWGARGTGATQPAREGYVVGRYVTFRNATGNWVTMQLDVALMQHGSPSGSEK